MAGRRVRGVRGWCVGGPVNFAGADVTGRERWTAARGLQSEAVEREAQLYRLAEQEENRRALWTADAVMRLDAKLIRRLWTALRDAEAEVERLRAENGQERSL